MNALPVVSLDDADIGQAIDAALTEIGFFILADHGVAPTVLADVERQALAFFDLPVAVKEACLSEGPGSPRGYIPFEKENLAATTGARVPPDLRDGFSLGPLAVRQSRAVIAGIDATYHPNRWPVEPAGFRPAIERYYRAMEQTTERLMRAFAATLALPEDFFTSRFHDHNSTLRLNHYPPLDRPARPGQLRAGAHTDYGALTILWGQDRPGGLQLQRRDGTWLDVAAPPDCFVINVGDLMMTWSNDRWVSTPHRVAVPPMESGPASRRLSMTYFCNPDDQLEIACLPTCCGAGHPAKYPPMRAGEHRHRKITASLVQAS
jgi:isopenicillin N synthase-like dioxygenase